MKKNHNITRRAACMLRMFWRTLERVPFICMVRTGSSSQRAVIPASERCGAKPLWNSGQMIIFHNTRDELCAII